MKTKDITKTGKYAEFLKKSNGNKELARFQTLTDKEFLESDDGKEFLETRLGEDSGLIEFDFENGFARNSKNGFTLPMSARDEFELVLDEVAFYED